MQWWPLSLKYSRHGLRLCPLGIGTCLDQATMYAALAFHEANEAGGPGKYDPMMYSLVGS